MELNVSLTILRLENRVPPGKCFKWGVMRMLAYEELKGSSGKDIWFRTPRYEARKLFPQSPPRVRLRSGIHQLQNISLGGVAVSCNQTSDDIPQVGEIVPLRIQQSGFSIFESDARVCRREDTVFGATLAFNFVNSFIEFEKLLSRNAQAHIFARADSNTSNSNLVAKEYRLFCADVLSTLRSYHAAIDDNVALAKMAGCNFDFNDCYDACETKLLQQWRPLWHLGNDLVRSVMKDRDALQATKQFSELVLTPELRLGSIWDRSYAKPFGYPGDFEIMNQVYSWQRCGTNTYSMLLHRIGLEVAECIKTRMELVRTHIATAMREKGIERPARILSLGSGPAREVEMVLSNPRGVAGRAEFTLIDQENAALRYAFEKIYPHILRSQDQVRLQCMNMSFTEILRGVDALGGLPPQDLIYSTGLIDYLTDRRATALVRRLYEALGSGGLLIIGNMNETPLSNLWPMECIADWTLHYRNNEEMLSWTTALKPAMAWTETDPTDRVRLLFVRKP
jgi:extracellular factor (EF) 3-hydroxypalmitic acid methyl ester biosynthesis protein